MWGPACGGVAVVEGWERGSGGMGYSGRRRGEDSRSVNSVLRGCSWYGRVGGMCIFLFRRG